MIRRVDIRSPPQMFSHSRLETVDCGQPEQRPESCGGRSRITTHSGSDHDSMCDRLRSSGDSVGSSLRRFGAHIVFALPASGSRRWRRVRKWPKLISPVPVVFFGVIGSYRPNPVINLRDFELPKTAELMGRKVPSVDPAVDGVPRHAEVLGNVVDGSPRLSHLPPAGSIVELRTNVTGLTLNRQESASV